MVDTRVIPICLQTGEAMCELGTTDDNPYQHCLYPIDGSKGLWRVKPNFSAPMCGMYYFYDLADFNECLKVMFNVHTVVPRAMLSGEQRAKIDLAPAISQQVDNLKFYGPPGHVLPIIRHSDGTQIVLYTRSNKRHQMLELLPNTVALCRIPSDVGHKDPRVRIFDSVHENAVRVALATFTPAAKILEMPFEEMEGHCRVLVREDLFDTVNMFGF